MSADDQRREAAPAEDKSPDLEHEEQSDAERRVAPSAATVYEAIHIEGLDELKRPSSALAWSGLAAGLSMGFSLVAEGLLHEALPDAPWRPLITKLGYSIGFLLVILGRQQLFTENTLTPILPLLRKPNVATLWQVIRLWFVVLGANTVGTLLFAWLLAHTPLFDGPTHAAFSAVSAESLPGSFFTHVLRAVLAGWLIALMVWLLPFAETGRVGVIILVTYLVGLGKFNHIIAGSVKTFYLATTGQLPWSAFVVDFWLPTLVGNILGGVGLVAALNHAQVTAGDNEEDDKAVDS